MGRIEPSGCSCSRVAPRPAVLASQWRRKGRDVSMTAFQSGDKYWGCGEFREEGTNGIFHCRGKIERGALFEKGRNRADEASHGGQELAIVAKTAKSVAKLFDVRRHRHACQGGDSIVVGADAVC